MADTDDDVKCSSMVDGLTPVERRTILSSLRDQFVKDFCHYYYGSRRRGYRHMREDLLPITTTKETTGGMAENYASITLVHPRYVFHPSDEPLLTYFSLDYLSNRTGEEEPPPTWLMPVIPIVLFNGGIGTKFNPWDVIAYFRERLSREDNGVHIRPWKNTETSADDDQMKKAHAREEGLSNIPLLDNEGRNRKYGGLKEILDEFYALRLESYKQRKSAMLKVIERAVYQLGEEASQYDGEYFDHDTMILDYGLSDEVLYAEAQNHIFRTTRFPMLDIEVGSYRQNRRWWLEKPRMFDILEEDVSEEDMWLNDLDAFQEQLNEQYKKQEPCEVRSSSLEEDASLVQDRDEPKMGKKRIRASSGGKKMKRKQGRY